MSQVVSARDNQIIVVLSRSEVKAILQGMDCQNFTRSKDFRTAFDALHDSLIELERRTGRK